jgi:NAD(P)-dependent dehydrogenase (short-subunit alcohol dehydrogenase family)
MSGTKRLHGKRALIFGAGGSVGSAVAREFAAEGAEVFLSGRNAGTVEAVVKQIEANGGSGCAAVLDATDASAVDAYVDGIATRAGGVDIVFNAIGPLARESGTGKTVTELSIDEFMVPLETIVKSQFITARAAAKHMLRQHSGVIVLLTGAPARSHVRGTPSIGAAFGAVESLTRNLALDLSPAGVRVVCVRSAAMIDSRTIQHAIQARSAAMNLSQDEAAAELANFTMLKVSPTVADTAKGAAFLASDDARMLTGTILNSSAGAVAD